ncbi:MAG TPA: outer membrane protein assembly factor BamC [Thioploca sp.]|nr:outer membrane protein assembly factor BamC [Thioploca sp.]
MLRLSKTVVWCLLVSAMGGCSTIDNALPDHRADYKKSKIVQPLELPPDLIGSTLIDEQMVVPDIAPNKPTTFSNYQGERTIGRVPRQAGVKFMPLSKGAQIKRDGKIRWLVLQGEPEVIWPKVKQFWREEGFTLKIENPTLGIIETGWAENRADLPQQGLRKLFGKVFDALHSASTRDKFRVRLERSSVAAGMTELYLTHRGVEEVAKGKEFVWQGRPSDSELEAEMLNRLMVFIGIEKKRAGTMLATAKDESVSRVQLTHTKEGQVNLIVREEFVRAWRRTGVALDSMGFTVEDIDRTRGLYFIRPKAEKKKGFWASLFGGSTSDNEEYRIRLIDEPPITRIVVLDSEDKMLANKKAEQILTSLLKQLK